MHREQGEDMADLKLNTADLRQAGSDLRLVAQEFTNANANTTALSDALGHEELASRVRGFAYGWDDKREKMVETIASMAEACTGIGEGFEDLDAEFAAALRGEG